MLSKRWIREDREEWGVPPPLGTKGKTIDSSRKVWSSGCQGIYDILCGPASQWHAVTSRPVPQPTLFVATQPLSWPINNINLPFLGSKGCRNYTKALIFAFSMTKDRADKRHWCRIDTTTSSNSRTLWLFVSPPPPPVIKSTFVSSTVALYAMIDYSTHFLKKSLCRAPVSWESLRINASQLCYSQCNTILYHATLANTIISMWWTPFFLVLWNLLYMDYLCIPTNSSWSKN